MLNVALHHAHLIKDPAVKAELEQVLATLQRWASGVDGQGQFKTVEYESFAHFAPLVTGGWVVNHGGYLLNHYTRIGNLLIHQVVLTKATVLAGVNQLRMRIPGEFRSLRNKTVLAGLAEWVEDGGGVDGVGRVYVDDIYLTVQRDNLAAPTDFPTSTEQFSLRFFVGYPVL